MTFLENTEFYYGEQLCSVLIICCAVTIILGKYYINRSSTLKNEINKEVVEVPVAPCGYFEGIQGFTGKDAPKFLLQMMKKCSENDVHKGDIDVGLFKLRLPLIKHGGLFFITDPNLARQILTDSKTYKPNTIYQPFDNIFGGKNLFTAIWNDDPKRSSARKGIMAAFSSSEVKRMNRICLERLEHWIETKLEPCISKNETFDPSYEMIHLLLSSILEIGFEYKAEESEILNIAKSFQVALKEFCLKEAGNPLRKPFGLLIPERRRAFQAAKEIPLFMAKVLKSYREKKDDEKCPNNTIIKLIANNPVYKDDEERLPDLGLLLLGGHDTTAYQLANTIVLLAKHPLEASKLRSEFVNGSSSESWSKSDYLDSIIKESSRMLPVGALGSIRTTGRTFTSKKDEGIVIPKDSVAVVSFHLINNNPSLFSNPSNFHPVRWMASSTSEKARMESCMMNFSLGARNCPGQRLATAELYSCIPLLFSQYKFEVVEEGKLEFFLTHKFVGTRLRAVKI